MKSPRFPQTLNSAGRGSTTLIKRLPQPGSPALRVRSAEIEVGGEEDGEDGGGRREGRQDHKYRQDQKTESHGERMPKALSNIRDAPPAIGTPFPHLIGQHHPELCSWGELENTAPNYCYHLHASCGDYNCASVSHSA